MASNSYEKRLGTFHPQSSLPQNLLSCPSNTPIKFAEAGWQRPHNSPPTSDELVCESCSVKHSGWEGESPIVVHRVKRPDCIFLNTEPSAQSQAADNFLEISASTSTPRSDDSGIDSPSAESIFSICNSNETNGREALKRKLFSCVSGVSHIDSEPDHSLSKYSRLREPIRHPFKPLVGGYPMLFENLRLTTYTSPHSPEAAKWAEDGFIMISRRKAQCVFCGLKLDFELRIDITNIHRQQSSSCPFVCLLFDVGNVSSEDHAKILEKERSKRLSCVSSVVNSSFHIKFPEFENVEDRSGTFNSWPKMLKMILPPKNLFPAGFFYTGTVITCSSE